MAQQHKVGSHCTTVSHNPHSVLTRKDVYPLGDRYDCPGIRQNTLRGQWTGEKRKPKAGEWFLSGALIAAYRAPVDLSTVYPIARIVVTRTRTVIDILHYAPPEPERIGHETNHQQP